MKRNSLTTHVGDNNMISRLPNPVQLLSHPTRLQRLLREKLDAIQSRADSIV